MTFDDYLKTLDIDANLGMAVFGIEDLRAAWKTATNITYNEGWQDAMSRLPKGSLVPEGYVLVPVEPDKALVYRVREILEEDNWRLSAENMRQLYSAVIQAAQEEERA